MAMIPAITTGIIDFMISSGLITDMAAIPVPDFAVPYAAPKAENKYDILFNFIHFYLSYLSLYNYINNYFIIKSTIIHDMNFFNILYILYMCVLFNNYNIQMLYKSFIKFIIKFL